MVTVTGNQSLNRHDVWMGACPGGERRRCCDRQPDCVLSLAMMNRYADMRGRDRCRPESRHSSGSYAALLSTAADMKELPTEAASLAVSVTGGLPISPSIPFNTLVGVESLACARAQAPCPQGI